MAGAPWFLLAAGIVLILIGSLWAAMPNGSGRERGIDPDMRDDEIIRDLKRAQRIPLPNLVILLGFACAAVSVGWRVARAVL